MSKVKEILKFLNLNNGEISICLQLLKQESTILELSKSTGIERTKIYRIIEKLISQGYIHERLEYKKKYYRISNLNILKDKVEHRINQAKVIENSLPNIFASIERSQQNNIPTNVKYYHGVSGIKQVLYNELKAKKEILAYSYRDLIEIVGRRFFTDWKFEFERRNLTLKDLRSKEFAKSTLKFKPIILKKDIKKYIDPKILDIITEVDIYNNTVVVFNWHKGDIYAVEIENEKFAKMQKQIFKVFWKLAKEYKRGISIK